MVLCLASFFNPFTHRGSTEGQNLLPKQLGDCTHLLCCVYSTTLPDSSLLALSLPGHGLSQVKQSPGSGPFSSLGPLSRKPRAFARQFQSRENRRRFAGGQRWTDGRWMEAVSGPDGIAMLVALLELAFFPSSIPGAPKDPSLSSSPHRAVANYGMIHCTPKLPAPTPKRYWP